MESVSMLYIYTSIKLEYILTWFLIHVNEVW